MTWRMQASVSSAVAAAAVLVAGCGNPQAREGVQSTTVPRESMDTSLNNATGTWAAVVMGGSAAQYNNFWQLFIRPAGTSTWKLVTPPGTADNGGLVLAIGAGPAAISAFRPSQLLTYTPLIQTGDGGKAWSALNPLDAPLASSPAALALDPTGSGELIALTTASTAEQASLSVDKWATLASLRTLAATQAGRQCGLSALTAVGYLPSGVPVLAGTCSRPGVAGIFADQDRSWQAAGPALPSSLANQEVTVLRLLTVGKQTVALLRAGQGRDASLLAAWSSPVANQWTVSPPLELHGTALTSASFGPAGSVATIIGGGTATVITPAATSWRRLPALPPGTATVAFSAAGPADALAVHGSTLTVWQVAAAGQAWTRVQVINVPIEYGSSD